ncbi:MAG: NAD(P)/FAD-dependent oxidoreductase, partial [Endomicrobium sp.]|nr:NAD(P)/FAD-dependent oxidoreductase [Endomicrobium sp.]
MRYLIIGNSAAGINAASAIRLMDPLGDITIITKEKFYSYGRPLISYYLSNKIQPENMYYHNQIFYTQQHLNIMLNTEVQAININRKELLIKTINNTKNVILYDKLLIASGSSPIKPSILGLDYNCNNVCTFLSYQDSIKLKSMITNSSKVVILGAGLIGLKVAEGLCGQVNSINVIDLSDRIMSSTLDISSAYIVQKHMESYNINFKLKTSVTEVLKDNNDKIYKVVLSNGETLDCNILIIAIGVTPNVHLAKQAGLNV